MRDGHLIDELSFDVRFDAPDPALEQQARVAAFVRGPALAIIDEVFAEASPPHEVLRLDRLTLDLGRVALGDLEAVWSDRLRGRLREALQDLVREARDSAAPAGTALGRSGPQRRGASADPGAFPAGDDARSHAPPGRRATRAPNGLSAGGEAGRVDAPGVDDPPPEALSADEARLQTWLDVLTRGHLPWHAGASMAARLGALAEAVLRDSGPRLAEALRRAGRPRRVAQRLVRQLPPSTLAALVRELAPGDAAPAALIAALVADPAPRAATGPEPLRGAAPEKATAAPRPTGAPAAAARPVAQAVAPSVVREATGPAGDRPATPPDAASVLPRPLAGRLRAADPAGSPAAAAARPVAQAVAPSVVREAAGPAADRPATSANATPALPRTLAGRLPPTDHPDSPAGPAAAERLAAQSVAPSDVREATVPAGDRPATSPVAASVLSRQLAERLLERLLATDPNLSTGARDVALWQAIRSALATDSEADPEVDEVAAEQFSADQAQRTNATSSAFPEAGTARGAVSPVDAPAGAPARLAHTLQAPRSDADAAPPPPAWAPAPPAADAARRLRRPMPERQSPATLAERATAATPARRRTGAWSVDGARPGDGASALSSEAAAAPGAALASSPGPTTRADRDPSASPAWPGLARGARRPGGWVRRATGPQGPTATLRRIVSTLLRWRAGLDELRETGLAPVARAGAPSETTGSRRDGPRNLAGRAGPLAAGSMHGSPAAPRSAPEAGAAARPGASAAPSPPHDPGAAPTALPAPHGERAEAVSSPVRPPARLGDATGGSGIAAAPTASDRPDAFGVHPDGPGRGAAVTDASSGADTDTDTDLDFGIVGDGAADADGLRAVAHARRVGASVVATGRSARPRQGLAALLDAIGLELVDGGTDPERVRRRAVRQRPSPRRVANRTRMPVDPAGAVRSDHAAFPPALSTPRRPGRAAVGRLGAVPAFDSAPGPGVSIRRRRPASVHPARAGTGHVNAPSAGPAVGRLAGAASPAGSDERTARRPPRPGASNAAPDSTGLALRRPASAPPSWRAATPSSAPSASTAAGAATARAVAAAGATSTSARTARPSTAASSPASAPAAATDANLRTGTRWRPMAPRSRLGAASTGWRPGVRVVALRAAATRRRTEPIHGVGPSATLTLAPATDGAERAVSAIDPGTAPRGSSAAALHPPGWAAAPAQAAAHDTPVPSPAGGVQGDGASPRPPIPVMRTESSPDVRRAARAVAPTEPPATRRGAATGRAGSEPIDAPEPAARRAARARPERPHAGRTVPHGAPAGALRHGALLRDRERVMARSDATAEARTAAVVATRYAANVATRSAAHVATRSAAVAEGGSAATVENAPAPTLGAEDRRQPALPFPDLRPPRGPQRPTVAPARSGPLHPRRGAAPTRAGRAARRVATRRLPDGPDARTALADRPAVSAHLPTPTALSPTPAAARVVSAPDTPALPLDARRAAAGPSRHRRAGLDGVPYAGHAPAPSAAADPASHGASGRRQADRPARRASSRRHGPRPSASAAWSRRLATLHGAALWRTLCSPSAPPPRRQRCAASLWHRIDARLAGAGAPAADRVAHGPARTDLSSVARPAVPRAALPLTIGAAAAVKGRPTASATIGVARRPEGGASLAQRLATRLSAAQQHELLGWLCPDDRDGLLDCVDLMLAACRGTGLAVPEADLARQAWTTVWAERLGTASGFDPGALAVAMFEHLARVCQAPEPERWRQSLGDELWRLQLGLHAGTGVPTGAPTRPGAEPGATPAGLARTMAAALGHGPAQAAHAGRPGGGPASSAAELDIDTAPDFADEGPIQIGNAGVVLVAPYLPRLFDRLGLTAERRFVSDAARERAVHLLQVIVDERGDAPEPLLVLNKLLCGLPIDAPLPREIEVLDAERAAIDGLLQAVIAHWSAIGKTTVAGLRQTFLQREGRLVREGEAWRLQVAPGPYDMLLDRLPWGYAMLTFPWMEGLLHVDWR